MGAGVIFAFILLVLNELGISKDEVKMLKPKAEDKKAETASIEDKIALIAKPRKIQYLPYSYASIGIDEILVRVVGCGLDHTDIPLWEGRDWIEYPLPNGLPGREAWGFVEKAGSNTKYKQGDLVAVFAPNGLANKVICKYDKVCKLPADFKNLIFPAKAFAFAINIFEQIQIEKDEVVIVLGNGFVSSVICFLLRDRGAKILKVANGGVDKNAQETFSWHELDKLSERTSILTKDQGGHKIIECTGSTAACGVATNLIRSEGNLILARQPKNKRISIDMENPCAFNITYAYDQSVEDLKIGVDKAITLVKEGKLKPEHFINKTYPFEQLEKAFNELCNDAGEFNKLCITF